MPEVEIGKIIHVFGKIGVGVLKLKKKVKGGDKIKVKGGSREFEQVLSSIQVNHASVEEAGPKDDIGVKFDQEVKEGDVVYKVS